MPNGSPVATSPRLLDLLTLEKIDRDLYRSQVVFQDVHILYGGQVAAQALLAAGLTVPDGRAPHSLHGYFLRSGDAARPTVFRVDRDRDGRSFSARRVVAVQDGEVILNMAASFHRSEEGLDRQVEVAPTGPPPEQLPPLRLPRLFGVEGRRPTQPDETVTSPTRLWMRATEHLPDDPMLRACVLTYLSDLSTGLGSLRTPGAAPGSTIDHAVWFHRAARPEQWMLMDLRPGSVAGGRGWYTGSIFDADGVLVASLTQELLFRAPRQPARPSAWE